jgi:hypothetical protein
MFFTFSGVPISYPGVFDWLAVCLDHLAAQAVDMLLYGTHIALVARRDYYPHNGNAEQDNYETDQESSHKIPPYYQWQTIKPMGSIQIGLAMSLHDFCVL